MDDLQGPTLSDCKGERRIRRMVERISHIDALIAELEDKKYVIMSEVRQMREGS